MPSAVPPSPNRARRWPLVAAAALLGALTACANAPAGGLASAGAGEPPPTIVCESHESCPTGQVCVFDGAEGHCAPPCTLTGACAEDGGEAGAPAASAVRADGAPCAAPTDCGGGACLGAGQGYPDGYCTTTDCETVGDCHGARARCLRLTEALTICVASCATDADCRVGYACQPVDGGGYCAPVAAAPPAATPSEPATPSAPPAPGTEPPPAPATEAPPPAPPTAPPVGPTTTFTEFCDGVEVTPDAYGAGWDAYTVEVEVPSGAHSAQILAGAAAGFGGFDALSGERLRIDFTREYPRVNFIIPEGPTVNAVGLPHRPEVPAESIAGRFALRFVAREAPFCPVVVAKTGPGSRVDVKVVLAPGGGVPDAATAAQDAALQAVLRGAADIYHLAGISLNVVRYQNLGPAERQQFAIIRNETDVPALFRTSTPPGESVDDVLTLNLFVVQQILLGEGNVLGISGGIPGPAGVHGFGTSGVVMTAAVVADPEIGSQTLAHEMGHFLGLFHTTEVDAVMADDLTDTPECPADAWRRPDLPCPDFPNLMFPYAHPGAQVTAQQVQMLHMSPLVE